MSIFVLTLLFIVANLVTLAFDQETISLIIYIAILVLCISIIAEEFLPHTK